MRVPVCAVFLTLVGFPNYIELSSHIRNDQINNIPNQPHVNIPIGQRAIVYGFHFGSVQNGTMRRLRDDDGRVVIIRIEDGLVKYVSPEYWNALHQKYYLKKYARDNGLTNERFLTAPPGAIPPPPPNHM